MSGEALGRSHHPESDITEGYTRDGNDGIRQMESMPGVGGEPQQHTTDVVIPLEL